MNVLVLVKKTMSKTVYVVMRENADEWWAPGAWPAAVFTDYDEARAYIQQANQTEAECRGSGGPYYHYWLDPSDDIRLDPEPYDGETSWIRAVAGESS